MVQIWKWQHTYGYLKDVIGVHPFFIHVHPLFYTYISLLIELAPVRELTRSVYRRRI